MWVFDAETTGFLSVNDAAVQHYGYSRETFLGMKLRQIWPEDEWISHSEALQQAGETYHSGRNWRHLKADGGEIQVLTFGRRVNFEGPRRLSGRYRRHYRTAQGRGTDRLYGAS